MTGFPPVVRDQVQARAMFRCEVCGAGDIREIHHRRPRGMGGSSRGDTNKPSNALGVCSPCHRIIESNRTLALLMGWLIGQRDQPSECKVMRRGSWCWLTDDGGLTFEARS